MVAAVSENELGSVAGGVAVVGTIDDGFNVFWAEYPKHIAKKDALKAWTKLQPSAELLDTILQALRWQKATPAWQKEAGTYVPLAATWLRGERWDDEPCDTRPLLTAVNYDWICPHEPHCKHRAACAIVALRKP